jgi:hypothetical protein
MWSEIGACPREVVGLLPNGALDTSFESGGLALIGAGAGAIEVNDILIDANAAIVVAGTAGSDEFLVRVNL